MKNLSHSARAALIAMLSLIICMGIHGSAVFADGLTNGVNTIEASKTAQWTANGKGDDPASKYDTLISNYSANYYQTAYIGFDLPDDFSPSLVQNAVLKLTTKQLGTAITANVYTADYSGFENGGRYEKADNIPAFDSAVIGSIFPAAAGEAAGCDVTAYLKSLKAGDDAAFRIASGKGYTGWIIGSATNGGPAPVLEIEYDDGIGEHTVPERIDYENGSVTFDKTGTFAAGEKITLTVVPDAHYALEGLRINGIEVKPENGSYTFSMPSRNITANYISASFVLADYIKTRNIYEDNMMLQRDKSAYIDGVCKNINSAAAYLYKGDDTAPVQTKEVAISGDEWNVTLDPVSDYSDVYRIVVEGDNGSVTMNNVMFGDVYLFSGQSNMWKEVSYYKNLDSDYTQASVQKHLTDRIRVMYTKGSGCLGASAPLYDAANKEPWRDFSTYSNVSGLPAVAFSTAAEIYEKNGNVPVGVIANAYPGSYISCWFPNTGIDACNANRNKNSNERNWYNGRIYPIRNLKLSGIFWYQGEADSAAAYHSPQYDYYADMMPKLIGLWRDEFKDESLPFYYVQLCRLGETRDENNPDTTANGEVYVRQAQTDTYLNAENKANLGVVGTLDIYGRYEYPNTNNDANCRNDIHPGQKKIIGERLAAFALKDVYGMNVNTMGPVPKSAAAKAGSIVITYDCSGPLKIMDSAQYSDEVTAGKIKSGAIDANALNEFEVAGEDGKWHEAAARITADDQVTVYSDKVAMPVRVRYCYEDYPEAPNLTDSSDLPSYVFEMAAEPSEEEGEDVRITGASEDTAEIIAYGDIAQAVIAAASYRDGRLENVMVLPQTAIAKGVNTVKLPGKVSEGDVITVWDSISGMKPYGEAYTVPAAEAAPEPTDEPTPEPTAVPDRDDDLLSDGNIERITSVPDGAWKPSRGEWKKGLGTAVEADTETVSENSTRSIRITNAALFQGVSLSSGESYTLSFDIYLGPDHDASKLSWGIFGMKGNYVDVGVGCGYKGGVPLTESDFDESRTGEWQHVETEFPCAADAMYAVEFLYTGSDSINIDNVCVSDGKEPTMIIRDHTVTYSDEKGTYSLYGKLYRPANTDVCGAVIFSHGFAGGCDDFPADCKMLAENGFASFTFEFAGGSPRKQSKGRETTEMSIMTEKKDLLAVFDYVSGLEGIDTENMYLAGASQGGMISAMAAEELGDRVKGIGLYFPAYNIPDDWRKIYPTAESVPETFDKWGFTLGKVFCTDMIDYYPFEGDNIGKFKGSVVIMQGDADRTVPLKTAQEAVKHYENAELVVYEGEGHGFSAPNAQKARERLLELVTGK